LHQNIKPEKHLEEEEPLALVEKGALVPVGNGI
jgi:hypothetical protein